MVFVTAVPAAILTLAPGLSAGKRKQRKIVFKNASDRSSSSFVPARMEGQEETAPGIFVRVENGQPVAFSARCTHASCAVSWNDADKLFACPCHGGKFDSSGKVVAGPPPRPLEKLTVVARGEDLFVEEPEA